MGAPRRFTNDEIRLMRECYAEHKRLLAEAGKLSPTKIAEKFGICTSSLHEILNYVSYTKVV